MGLLAIVVEGPALPERGCSGVGAPSVLDERGGRRVLRVLLLRSEGSCGSGWMAPSFWRSRILKSRRLIWRSSWVVLVCYGERRRGSNKETRKYYQ